MSLFELPPEDAKREAIKMAVNLACVTASSCITLYFFGHSTSEIIRGVVFSLLMYAMFRIVLEGVTTHDPR